MQRQRVFPRFLPLPDPDTPPTLDRAPLMCGVAKLSDVADPGFWQKLCPELTCSGASAGAARAPFDLKELAASVQQGVEAEGVAVAHSDELPWEGLDFALLARCIVRLMQYGWPATFILMYDEAWSLIHQLGGLMDQATGNRVNMDILA